MMNEQKFISDVPVLFQLQELAVIKVDGEEAIKYLNGQVTCDVNSLAAGQSSLGAHCTPKGKVLAIFHLFKTEDALWLVYPKSLVTKQLAELKKYAVFSKVTISDVSQEYSAYGLTAAGDAIHQFTTTQTDSSQTVASVEISSDRVLFIALASAKFSLPVTTEGSANWFALDILSGQPNLNAGIQDQFIPQAFNLHALDGISFTKGCYTGQEIVARARYRGTNNRSMYILEGSTTKAISLEDSIERQIGDNWRNAGTIVDLYQKDNTVLVTAILPSDTEETTQFRFSTDEESKLTIKKLPYSL